MYASSRPHTKVRPKWQNAHTPTLPYAHQPAPTAATFLVAVVVSVAVAVNELQQENGESPTATGIAGAAAAAETASSNGSLVG